MSKKFNMYPGGKPFNLQTNQCPRCKNEELDEDQNYCHICGLDLKRTAQEVPVQEQLAVTFIIDCQSFELLEYLLRSRLSKEEADKILNITAKSIKQHQDFVHKTGRQPVLSKVGVNKICAAIDELTQHL